LTPVVVDASTLVFAATRSEPAARRLRERLREEECHAPHLIDAELGNAVRRLVMQGELTSELAVLALRRGPDLIDQRYDHRVLLTMAWSLRANVTFYDALYVALADALDVPLLTLDRRLARTRGLPCRVELPRGA
jgi:predicted nucleic acid-binding protein